MRNVRKLNLLLKEQDPDLSKDLNKPIVEDVEWLAGQLQRPDWLCSFSNCTDRNLVYHVAGSVGRSVGRVKNVTVSKLYL